MRLGAIEEAAKEAERQRWVADFQRDTDGVIDAVARRPDTDRELRQQAALVVRCDDCGGRVVAHVTYIEGRPMLWTAQRDGAGSRSWIDGVFWGDTAWCRVREYVLKSVDLLPELRPRGKPAIVRGRRPSSGNVTSSGKSTNTTGGRSWRSAPHDPRREMSQVRTGRGRQRGRRRQ